MKFFVIMLTVFCILSASTEVTHKVTHEKRYYKNGTLRAVIPYKNNKINGNVVLYYKNKKVKSVTPFVNGDIVGVVKSYDKAEKLLYRVVMDSGGMVLDSSVYADKNTTKKLTPAQVYDLILDVVYIMVEDKSDGV